MPNVKLPKIYEDLFSDYSCIPESVTTIGAGAFSECRSLHEVYIPKSVTTIGDYAFVECRSLEDVSIPESVTSIGKGAFSNCCGLYSVAIPASVTSIGESAFEACVSLSEVIVRNTNPANISLGEKVFEGVYKFPCCLSAPDSAKSLYKTAPQWSDFLFLHEW